MGRRAIQRPHKREKNVIPRKIIAAGEDGERSGRGGARGVWIANYSTITRSIHCRPTVRTIWVRVGTPYPGNLWLYKTPEKRGKWGGAGKIK